MEEKEQGISGPTEVKRNLLEITMPGGLTLLLPEKDSLNAQLNRLAVAFLEDLHDYLNKIIRDEPIQVNLAKINEFAGVPAPTEQELAEHEARKAKQAAELREYQEWAQQRLEECQGAKAKLLARPLKF